MSTVNSLLWARQGTETTIISHALLSLDELPWDVPALGDSHHYTVDCFSYVSLSPGTPVHHINLIFISIVFLISLGGSQIELKHFDFYQGLQEQNYFHFFWCICVYKFSVLQYNFRDERSALRSEFSSHKTCISTVIFLSTSFLHYLNFFTVFFFFFYLWVGE